MNINYIEYTLILDSLKAYLDDDNEEYYNADIKSLINKLESNEIETIGNASLSLCVNAQTMSLTSNGERTTIVNLYCFIVYSLDK